MAGAFELRSETGLRAAINSNGSLLRLDCEAVTLNLFLGNELEGGPANLFMRRRGVGHVALLGPDSPTRFALTANGEALIGSGSWQGIRYQLTLQLARAARAWFWHVHLENTAGESVQLDLTYAQDLALTSYGAVRLNEYYVSQYIDHTALEHAERGFLIASRQNLAVDGRIPWTLIGSLRRGASYATDALQLYGLNARTGGVPPGLEHELPAHRLQHEHSMAVLRDAPLELPAGGRAEAGFFGLYLADHPAASSQADLAHADAALTLGEASSRGAAPGATAADAQAVAASFFAVAPPLECLALDDAALHRHFAPPWRHEEREAGELLSFFHGDAAHVVLRSKELRVLRPHGHLLRTGTHVTPDETGLTSTVWMSGVFHSMLTQGHVSINRMLSTVHTYLGLFRSHGLHLFVRSGEHWRLLLVPSAFEMQPTACRWLYQHEQGLIEVRSQAHSDPHALSLEVEFLAGEPLPLLAALHLALNGDDGSAPGLVPWRREAQAVWVAPAPGTELGTRFPQGGFRIEALGATRFERIGGDEVLFVDGRSHGEPYLCLEPAAARHIGFAIRGALIERASPPALQVPAGEALLPELRVRPATSGVAADHVVRLAEMLPWFADDAFVHYLSPRGLEQYSGGGWGTRDVCQGPVELLLAQGRTAALRDLLLRVMAVQNPDGDWPQWFMFFDRERAIRAGDSHGDVVLWPLLVLGQYLIASRDAAVLDERLPFFDPRGDQQAEHASLWAHVERALALVAARVIPGTRLAAYGHGDWNDSLQPVDPKLREHLCSAWTVTLHYQTLRTLAAGLRAIARDQSAAPLEAAAQAVLADFQRLLLPGGVLAGYALFEPGAPVRYLLHPSDDRTGVHFSSLAMVHAILEDMLTPEQTRAHLACIDEHLLAPDGLRLFDCPMPYHGGPQTLFQRAETATFFGREIGLMYMHMHLRYAQALAHLGDAQRFFHALTLANPIGIRSIVPHARVRQANCYYSSSDAAFADRYQASAQYARVANGTIALEGGWRVYSSGAGIAVGLILRRFLGLSEEATRLCIDPVIPASLDGLRVEMPLLGQMVEIEYRIGPAGCGVRQVTLSGQPLTLERESNPHRPGAVSVERAQLVAALARGTGPLQITLG